jgi:putative spermidine/putrescine transport system substrate-binding protein
MPSQLLVSIRCLTTVTLTVSLLFFIISPAPSAPPPTELVVYTGIAFGPLLDKSIGKIMLEKFNTKVVWQELLIQQAFTKVLAQKAHPEVSVSVADGVNYQNGEKVGLWADLDPKIVTNLQYVYPAAMVPFPGRHGVPFEANTVGIQYRTDVFLKNGFAPPTGYADLWRPEFKGRVAFTSAASGTGMRAMLILARTKGGGENNIEPGFQLVKDLVKKQQVTIFPTSSSEFNNFMQRGEIWIGVQFSEGGHQFAARGAPVAYIYPKEGSSLGVSAAMIVKGAPHQELAQQFVNLLISPEFQTEMALDRWGIPTRTGITLPPQYVRQLPLSPTEWSKSNMVNHDWPVLASHFNEWSQRWLREVEGKQ